MSRATLAVSHPVIRDVVRLAAMEVPGVLRVHDARSRGRRDAVYVDLTVHLDGSMSLQQAHCVADRIEAELQKTHPEIVDVVVHLEPEGHEGKEETTVPSTGADGPLSGRLHG